MPKLYSYDIDDALDFEVVETFAAPSPPRRESKRWKHSSLRQHPCSPRLHCTSRDSIRSGTLSVFMSVPIKMPDPEHYAKDFDHVYYPQTAADWSEICQELAGDYDTIFMLVFDNRLILDLVASSTFTSTSSFR